MILEETRVERFFREKGIQNKILYLNESSATVPLAAKALGEKEERIAKSLAFRLKEGEIVLVTCGTARIDNKKFKAAFSCKAKMLSSEETKEATGHPVGGVCPFALPGEVGVFLDESLKRFDYVYPAAGTANSAVKMTPHELARYTGGTFVDVCEPIPD